MRRQFTGRSTVRKRSASLAFNHQKPKHATELQVAQCGKIDTLVELTLTHGAKAPK